MASASSSSDEDSLVSLTGSLTAGTCTPAGCRPLLGDLLHTTNCPNYSPRQCQTPDAHLLLRYNEPELSTCEEASSVLRREDENNIKPSESLSAWEYPIGQFWWLFLKNTFNLCRVLLVIIPVWPSLKRTNTSPDRNTYHWLHTHTHTRQLLSVLPGTRVVLLRISGNVNIYILPRKLWVLLS